MTLGEFRKQTAELSDDAELIIVNIFNEEFYGKFAGELTIIPSNSAKITDGSTNFVSTPGFDDFGFFEDEDGFILYDSSESQKINLSKPLIIMRGCDFYD